MKKCIIGTHEKMFSQMIAYIVTSFNADFAIAEVNDLEELYEELDSDNELVIVLDPHAFSIELEKVCTKIYTSNPRAVIICLCKVKCAKFFGLRLFRCGVNCIISDVDNSRDFILIIKNAFKGVTYYPPEILEAIAKREHILMGEFCTALSIQQIKILSYLADNQQPKYIALSLNISESTIWSTLNRIMKKLGVESKDEAIQTAIESGLFGK